ncbi:acyl-CoA dehydrogenase family protein [Parageobacillus thermoglucosidasius]|uniref:acyl-CoA dehydrogenase family protein n=1 Tax=Parageobacillus thermoglucosidasius TaxID=1426 RepID=UPI000B570014|nr:acyl-CoA dehydrogenase family protein [Parageobacillus thermoglucosidasius]OUM92069.1 MAG: acyl-CoA dehydrogenase [Parageobacillus thermoglucosidasius]
MNFELTEEQKALKKVTSEICKSFTDEYWRKIEKEHRFPQEFWDACAEAGLLGVMISEEYGGSGLNITEAVIILMEVAKSAAGMDGASALHLSIFGANPLFYHGTKEQCQKYLPDVASGKLHVCFGVTEPNAGTDTSRITTYAVKKGNKYIINGHKVFITKAQKADRILLLTRTTPYDEVKKKTDGMTLFFAPMDRSAITIREIEKMGRNGIDTNELFIENLEVDEFDRIGEEGKGFYYLLDGLNPERLLIAAEAIGMGYGAIERACQYARERVVFGRPIGQNQGVQFPLADAYSQLRAAEALLFQGCWLYENGKPCGAEANMAKLRASEAGFYAVDAAFQTFGGYAYAREYNIERIYRQIRLTRIAPITNEMVKNFIAEKVLGLPRSY